VNIALDTNILVYFEAVNTPEMTARTIQIIQSLRHERLFVATQSMGELFHVLVRKGGLTRKEARERVNFWCSATHVVESSLSVLNNAMELAVSHQFQIWDSIILAAAVNANCQMLLSEDLQSGFTWDGVTVINPFADEPHWLLRALLENQDK